MPDLRVILSSNMLTNVNNYTSRFEDSIKGLLGTRNVVAVSSATSGLMLVLEALGVRGKEVVLPSFTFAATAASAYWTSNRLAFADIDDTFTLDPTKVRERVNDRTGAILAVHMYGNPVHVNKLKEISEEKGIPLIIDAAHAIGASYHGKKCGNLGIPEVFSLSPTKLITSVEGGIITTDDDELAEKLRIMRNYGLDKNYESEIPGLNARMSEVHAAIGLSQVDDIDKFVTNRNEYVKLYKNELNGIPGLSFQKIPPEHISSHKDFSIIINKNKFGSDRDQLGRELTDAGIGVKKYFYPPVHRLNAYRDVNVRLPITDIVSNNVLSLPIYNYMEKEEIEFITKSIITRGNK
ncbi:MAG: DegT/DnrJ/EryC1/StrS family aminotransferase [Candidatus Thermoplasmatota archaeon]|jgi:dTDP-4-amino-4,6-dideoxygalactose transaminase|nr:DegT/DnrJ/EryC1/StrS family aminotransferase [Candidatus Thermoplasmatota archaeon]